jgi:anti-sigma factor RsiW
MMNQEEVTQLLPDLVDGTLSDDERAQAEVALQQYPELQRDLEIARQVRTVLATLQANYPEVRVPAGFEARLLARVRQRNASLEVLDLSCTTFTAWLVEFINLLGGLLVPVASPSRSTLPLGS